MTSLHAKSLSTKKWVYMKQEKSVYVKSHEYHKETHNCVTRKSPLMRENAAGCYWPLYIRICPHIQPLPLYMQPRLPPQKRLHRGMLTPAETLGNKSLLPHPSELKTERYASC